VISHLNQENDYTAAVCQPLEPLQQVLYKEFISHLKEDDFRAPFRWGPYYYSKKTSKVGCWCDRMGIA